MPIFESLQDGESEPALRGSGNSLSGRDAIAVTSLDGDCMLGEGNMASCYELLINFPGGGHIVWMNHGY